MRALAVVPVLVGLAAVALASPVGGVSERTVDIFEMHLADFSYGEHFLGVDNANAHLAWERSVFIESVLNGYLATGKRRYLDLFERHVNDIFSLRDDRLGRRDYSGRSRPGWQVAGHYTYSEPVNVLDEHGNVSLQLTASRWTGNQATKVSIRRNQNGFSLVATNGFRVDSPLVVIHNRLDMQSVERIVNSDQSRDALLRVKVIGSSPPRDYSEIVFKPQPMVFHTHHSAAILAPIIRASMLARQGLLPAEFVQRSQRWLALAEETLRDYEDRWVQGDEDGYYQIEPGSPFWVDGAPEPINAMAEQGRAHLYLWQASGNGRALDRVRRIIRLIAKNSVVRKSGSLSWPYWHGAAYIGWNETSAQSRNTPVFPPYQATDTTHYAQYTIRFIAEAMRAGIDTSPLTRDALVRTFEAIWKGDSALGWLRGGYLAPGMDGRGWAVGRDDDDIYGFAVLARDEVDVRQRLLRIYACKFHEPSRNVVVLMGWSYLLDQRHFVECP